VFSPELKLSTAAHNVKAGDYVTIDAEFVERQESNAAILSYSFDGDKFEYANFSPAPGVIVVDAAYGTDFAKLTVVSMDYDLQSFGTIMLRSKEDATLANEYQSVSLAAQFVVKDSADDKVIRTSKGDVRFTTVGGVVGPVITGDTNGDGVVDLIDLSNMVDWFGFKSDDANWETLYTFFDYNNNGEIDISDISTVAQLL
jgi:hypothetical protein